MHFMPDKYLDLIKYYLKATMAHQLFGTEMYEDLISQHDQIIQKVIELSKKDPVL